jgi:hypothetical protein
MQLEDGRGGVFTIATLPMDRPNPTTEFRNVFLIPETERFKSPCRAG